MCRKQRQVHWQATEEFLTDTGQTGRDWQESTREPSSRQAKAHTASPLQSPRQRLSARGPRGECALAPAGLPARPPRAGRPLGGHWGATGAPQQRVTGRGASLPSDLEDSPEDGRDPCTEGYHGRSRAGARTELSCGLSGPTRPPSNDGPNKKQRRLPSLWVKPGWILGSLRLCSSVWHAGMPTGKRDLWGPDGPVTGNRETRKPERFLPSTTTGSCDYDGLGVARASLLKTGVTASPSHRRLWTVLTSVHLGKRRSLLTSAATALCSGWGDTPREGGILRVVLPPSTKVCSRKLQRKAFCLAYTEILFSSKFSLNLNWGESKQHGAWVLA